MLLSKLHKRFAVVLAICALATLIPAHANATALTTASLLLADTRPGATASYTVTASSVTTSTIRCIRIEFDSAVDGTGGKPTAMNISSLAFDATSNFVPSPVAWSTSNNNTTGVTEITLAGGATPAAASNRTLVLTGIVNTSATGTFYALINTYNNVDCSSSAVDNVTLPFVIKDGIIASAIVDPTLTFSVADNGAGTCNGVTHTAGTSATPTAVSLGRVNPSNLPFHSQNLIIGTNAASGFTIYARYTGQMNDGNGHNIANWTGTNATPTTSWSVNSEYFGYTTDDATLGTGTTNRFTTGGGNKFAALSTTDAEVSYAASGPVAADTACVGYQIAVNGNTRAASYSTTVVYTAVPVF